MLPFGPSENMTSLMLTFLSNQIGYFFYTLHGLMYLFTAYVSLFLEFKCELFSYATCSFHMVLLSSVS